MRILRPLPAAMLWLMVLMLTALSSTAQDGYRSGDRLPAFAGSFYPESKGILKADLDRYFRQALPIEVDGKVQTVVVPHAGYAYSAIVAASAYKSIPKEAAYKNIFLIASSHREHFKGASVYASGDYLTPLGRVKVNTQIARKLIDENSHILFLEKAHDREHSIEVQLPLLQQHLSPLPLIVPIVIGSSDLKTARDLAAALLPWFSPDNLFVISSDFSHYPSYEDAKRVDQLTGQAICKKDPAHFYEVLRRHSQGNIPNLVTPSCGWASIMTMLYMADRSENLEIKPVLYRNSGDSPIGDKDRVVGYWALLGFEGENASSGFSLKEREQETLLEISRHTLENWLESGTLAEVPSGVINKERLSATLRQPAGVFVSLYMGGRLRGCIGNFSPDKPLYMVVQEMTLAAATNDPRFAPVAESELPYLSIEISVLSPLQKISSIEEFEIGRHGIYMRKGSRSGTFLPQVATANNWSAEEFFGHCAKDKAGIGWEGWKDAELFVYEALVFGEQKKL